MIYPKKLAEHKTPVYKYNDFIIEQKKEFSYVFSFFHEKKYLPLLMHEHDFYEINIIIEGEGMHYIENNRCPAKIGSVFVIPPFVKHGYFSKNNDLLIFNLEISNAFITKYNKELSSLAGYSMLFEIEPQIRANFSDMFLLTLSKTELLKTNYLIDELAGLEYSKYKGINVVKEAMALALIGKLTKIANESNEIKKNKVDVSKNTEIAISLIRAIEFIHANYAEKIVIDELASSCAMSKISFLRYFKKIFGVTPYDYLIKHRIKVAKELINNTNKSFSFIAQDVGFYDLSHFEHYFVKFENCTPSQYRKKKVVSPTLL